MLLITVLAVSCASTITSKKKDDNQGAEFVFIERSEGLPSAGQWRERVALYDMNGDGHLDIVALPPRLPKEGEDSLAVWHGDGKGKWTLSRPNVPSDMGLGYGSVTVADFDGDTIPDIGLAMHGVGLKVLKGKGDNRYEELSKGLPSGTEFSSRALVSADFDHDGNAEIAAISEGKFSMEYPSPSGLRICSWIDKTWKCDRVGEESAVKGLFADGLTLGDVNGDGNLDIAVASLEHHRSLIVWTGDGKGGFQPFNEGLTQEKHYLSVALTDINGDGNDDLLASITGFGKEPFLGLKAFLSGPDGFTEISDGLPVSEVFSAIDACDIDGDGSVEIVAGERGLKIFSYRGGRWQQVSVSGLPEKDLQRIRNIYLIDVNRDGHKDIVFNYSYGENNNGGIRVFLYVPRETEKKGK